jgi:hypothetical protein
MIVAMFIAQLVAAYVQIAQSLNIDQSDFNFVKENRLNYTSTNSYAQAINYGQTHPTRDGGSWSGWFVILDLQFLLCPIAHLIFCNEC